MRKGELVIIKVCEKGHKTDLGPHIEGWEFNDSMLRCPHCGSKQTDFTIGERQ